MKQIVKHRLRKYSNGGDVDRGSMIGEGVASGAASGMAMGTSIMPGYGTAIGGILGAGYGAVTGMNKADEAQAAQLQQNRMKGMQIDATSMATMRGMPNNNITQNDLKFNSGNNFGKGGIETNPTIPYADGGIHIKPENKGKFTATKKKTGKSTEELTHSKNPITKKRAIFAQNSKKWHHADGGIQGYQPNAELEQGEPYMTPDGQIGKISDQAPTHAQGGVGMNLPEGTQILGKNKFMGKEFKKLGSELKRTQDQANKSIDEAATNVTRETAIRNLNNVKKKWSALMRLQEAEKQQVQSPQYAKGGQIPKYGIGTPGTYREPTEGEWTNNTITPNSNVNQNSNFDGNYNWGNNLFTAPNANNINISNTTEPSDFNTSQLIKQPRKPMVGRSEGKVLGSTEMQDAPIVGAQQANISVQDSIGRFANQYKYNGEAVNPANTRNVIENNIRGAGAPGWDTVGEYRKYDNFQGQPLNGTSTNSISSNQYRGGMGDKMSSDIVGKGGSNDNGYLFNQKGAEEVNLDGSAMNKGIDWGNTVMGIASMAPTAYNLAKGIWGKPDTMNASAYQNPYQDEALSTLKNRKADIDPQLYEAKVNRNVNNYNAKQGARSQSEMLNRQQSSAQQENKQVADLYAWKNNQENQYKGDYANALQGYGAQNADTRFKVDMFNKQQTASKNNFLSTGISQGSQALVDYMKTRNQKNVDQEQGDWFKQYPRYYNYDDNTKKLTPKTAQ